MTKQHQNSEKVDQIKVTNFRNTEAGKPWQLNQGGS
uniref:Uncharacterized protein n=1 Tax=Manihot esculenta TaxID=3983 RepID=A0A2C9VUX1_MANES